MNTTIDVTRNPRRVWAAIAVIGIVLDRKSVV